MKYSIVIPTYNHCDKFLKPCLESIFKHSSIGDIELIISANGCTDNTLGYLGSLKEKFNSIGLNDNLKIYWTTVPLGYARATNVGLAGATSDKIVLLNNDTVLLDQPKDDWLTIMNSAFDHTACGISAPLLKFSEVTNRNFGIFFCVMIARKVFDTIGYLSEDYGTGGHEDTDFCMTAELAGFHLMQPTTYTWSEIDQIHVGSYPIYHRGEGTVHDPELVQNWTQTFYKNELTLARKFNPEWYEKHKNDVII